MAELREEGPEEMSVRVTLSVEFERHGDDWFVTMRDGYKRPATEVEVGLWQEVQRLRKALEVHRHTEECLEAAARTGKNFCIAPCADTWREALS